MDGIKKLLGLVVFVAAFAGVRHLLTPNNEQSAVDAAQRSIDQLRVDGAKNHPGEPLAEAMQKEAAASVERNLTGETDPQQRLQRAAASFMGFYLVNTRERTAYCKEQGVSIAPYVDAFRSAHRAELATALGALRGQSLDEDKLYGLLRDQFRQMMAQDMKDIAASQQLSPQGACEIFSSSGAALATEMHISKRQPAVYAVLAASP